MSNFPSNFQLAKETVEIIEARVPFGRVLTKTVLSLSHTRAYSGGRSLPLAERHLPLDTGSQGSSYRSTDSHNVRKCNNDRYYLLVLWSRLVCDGPTGEKS